MISDELINQFKEYPKVYKYLLLHKDFYLGPITLEALDEEAIFESLIDDKNTYENILIDKLNKHFKKQHNKKFNNKLNEVLNGN